MPDKLLYIDLFVIPGLRAGASILKAKDTNSTGKDDLTAAIFMYAAEAYEAVRNDLPMPDLPKELRPKAAAE